MLPLSKSIAARVLVTLFWGGGCLDCIVLPDGDDSRELRDAFRMLEAWKRDPENSSTAFHLGEGASSLRFFLPVVASIPGLVAEVDCGEGLRKRPVAGLVDAVRELGGSVRWRSEECRPPFLVAGQDIAGGEIEMDASVSSQYVSALMLSAPMWDKGLRIGYKSSHAVSAPYIEMTSGVMRRMGSRVEVSEDGVRVFPGGYSSPVVPEIEYDWSAASYFYEWLLARGEGEVEIVSLTPPGDSLQGDSRCMSLMEEVGIMTSWRNDGSILLSMDKEKWLEASRKPAGVCWNLESTPDLVPAFAVGLCHAGIRFRFEGVGHLRHKECDRIDGLISGLSSLGYKVCADEGVLYWNGETTEHNDSVEAGVEISPLSDHRMAMAFGVVESLHPGLRILDKKVVAKSFPTFWRELSKLNLEN